MRRERPTGPRSEDGLTLADNLAARDPSFASLTGREHAVLKGIMRGDRDREIAAYLGLSPSSVRQCGVSLRAKLGARSRTELAVRAVAAGFTVELRGPHQRAS
ncbi:MAG TPA: helix-turn-helix transcriptional regulator [Chloroflexota bacterium]